MEVVTKTGHGREAGKKKRRKGSIGCVNAWQAGRQQQQQQPQRWSSRWSGLTTGVLADWSPRRLECMGYSTYSCVVLFCLLGPSSKSQTTSRSEIAETLRCSGTVADCRRERITDTRMDSLWIGDGWLRHLRGRPGQPRTATRGLAVNQCHVMCSLCRLWALLGTLHHTSFKCSRLDQLSAAGSVGT